MSATSSGCCRRKCPLPVCTAWSWIPSAGGLQSSSIPMRRLPWAGLRPRTAAISTTWPWATCRSASTRSMTGPITSWAFPSTTTSLPKRWTRCAPAAWWPLSPAGTPWTPKTRLCAAIWPSGPTSLGRSGCPTMRSVPMPGRMWFPTSSFYRSGTVPLPSSRNGYTWGRMKMGFPSTATLWTTRR